MRLTITACLCLLCSIGIAQDKKAAPVNSSVELKKENVKVVTETTELKSILPSATAVEGKRVLTPKQPKERSKEMLERKKQAPMLNDPQ